MLILRHVNRVRRLMDQTSGGSNWHTYDRTPFKEGQKLTTKSKRGNPEYPTLDCILSGVKARVIEDVNADKTLKKFFDNGVLYTSLETGKVGCIIDQYF